MNVVRCFQMKKRDVGDHEDKCSKEHMRLLLKNVDELKAQLQRRPYESCKFMWKIENWSKTLQTAKMEKGECMYVNSSSFYTGYPGYQLCMVVHPNGNGIGIGTHVGVYLVIMKGDFDHQLHWPFSYSYRLTVIDQQPDGKNVSELVNPTKEGPDSKECFERKTKKTLKAWGFHKFISHLDLTNQTRAYIRDDSLLVSAEILI